MMEATLPSIKVYFPWAYSYGLVHIQALDQYLEIGP